MNRRFRLRAFLAFLAAAAAPWLAHAQDVTITPLGAVDGEFCVGDRALLFEDPTGVRVLIAPGRTVRGSTDSRLPQPGTAGGSVHVVLIDHPHTDHIGDVLHTNCAGTTTQPFAFPSAGNAAVLGRRVSASAAASRIRVSGSVSQLARRAPRSALRLAVPDRVADGPRPSRAWRTRARQPDRGRWATAMR